MDNNNVAYLAGRKLINYGSSREPWFSVTEIMEQCRLNLILINDLIEFVDSNNKKKVYSRSIENQEKVQLWIVNTFGAVDVAFDSGKYDYADLYTNGFIKVEKSVENEEY